MLKNCVICGKEFNAITNRISCSTKCSRLRQYEMIHNWNQAHPEQRRKMTRKWCETNPERRYEANRRWDRTSRGRASKVANRHNRRVQLSGAEVTAGMVLELKAEYGGRCPYCNQTIKRGHIDHIIPACKGGTNERSNLVWVCSTCNQQKNGKSLLQFMLYRQRLAGNAP